MVLTVRQPEKHQGPGRWGRGPALSWGAEREEGGGLALGEGVQEWEREDKQETISWRMVKRCQKPRDRTRQNKRVYNGLGNLRPRQVQAGGMCVVMGMPGRKRQRAKNEPSDWGEHGTEKGCHDPMLSMEGCRSQ